MWKALLLLAFVASFDMVISCDDDEPPATTTTTESPHEPNCGCGGHPPKCGKNEVWNNCSDTNCRPTCCSELGYPLKCDKKCKPGCVCKGDYVRDDNGVCIPIKNCPSCGGDPNAESGCGNNCGKTCATHKIKNPMCPLGCQLNGCDCRDGYVYDPAVKKCVCPKDCTPTCKANEEYSPCINGGCGPRNCSQIGQPDVCIDPKTCIKGCVCVKGYLRAANGTCVPKDECPPPACPCNEVWDKCPTVKCDGDWCPKTRDSPQWCPVGTVCDKPRCVCAYNRKRDWKTGKCIPIRDCPPFKCDCNEEYQPCSPSCPGDKCSTSKPICPKTDIIEICRPQCRCTKGNCRNSEGKCVPECEGNPPKCGKNEVWNNCSDTTCRPTCCSELGYPLKCDKKCKPGCVCKDDYVRDDNGVCIPIKNCPSCGGDPNAESGCGNNCGKTCATYKIKHPSCPKICRPNGCDCRDGYVYDPAVKKCVCPEDCTPDCPTGEVWSKCPKIKCDGDWCPKTRDSPQWCTGGIVCDKPRCVCENNRKRDWKTGKCILITDCPPFKCDCNEEYQACSPSCPDDKCSTSKPICPKTDIIEICRPQCRCTKGHCRNSDGKCVLACRCAADSPVEKS